MKLSLTRHRLQPAKLSADFAATFLAKFPWPVSKQAERPRSSARTRQLERRPEKSQAFLHLCDRLCHHSQPNNHQRNSAPAQCGDPFAQKNPAAKRHQDINDTRKRVGERERDVPKHVKATD